MDVGSRGSGPAITPSSRAASATVRVIGPLCDRAAQMSAFGQYGTRPNDGFKPKTPQSAAGIRIDPAPSEPCARGPSPAATAAAAPPLEAPEVRSSFHGLRHGGPMRLSHMSLYPQWGVLVLPSTIPPAALTRSV